MAQAQLLAGYPDRYPNVLNRCGFVCGDLVVWIDDGQGETHAIVRNIELPRARAVNRASAVHCPEDLVAADQLSSDRDTTFAQATAALLKRKKISAVRADAMLPLLFSDVLHRSGIEVQFDAALGRRQRRSKRPDEIEHLRQAQTITESAITHVYEIIHRAAIVDGILHDNGKPLTSKRIRASVTGFLLKHEYSCPGDLIIAAGPQGSDCHHHGAGVLRASEPIIVDIFPMNTTTRYWGDCTRTFVRGTPDPKLARMHALVVKAKAAAITAARAGSPGSLVHQAVLDVFKPAGIHIGIPAEDAPVDLIFYPHGTGHGIGLECHEAPILDERCPDLVEGDALTIEPGLYCKSIGGVRVEDMVIVGADSVENLNTLPEALAWD